MIEDYALIGNLSTAALVDRNGSIDWLCLPDFDSQACFAALLGSERNGRWRICPRSDQLEVQRQYRKHTLVLETTFTSPEGSVVLVDAMSRRSGNQDVLRVARGVQGCVPMQMNLLPTSDYGLILPRFMKISETSCAAIAGANQFLIHADVPIELSDRPEVCADFSIEAGQELCFSFTWAPSHLPQPRPPDVRASISGVETYWNEWSKHFNPVGDWSEFVLRSLITLRALTYDETGGFVAAPTTSLPEASGGDKNWDYRACWLRDGAFSLRASIDAGFKEEGEAWCRWLLRAVAGSPDKLQIVYGIHSERDLNIRELPWLSGYAGSRPVRTGNLASEQFQLDVYGQVLDILFQAREVGMNTGIDSWPLERALLDELLRRWRNPGAGIWESRTQDQQYTESKIMAWVALDRGIRSAENYGLPGNVQEWRRTRGEVHDEVCRAGFNPRINSFVQYYGGGTLDGSLLLAALFDFLPANDPRILGTVRAIEGHLLRDGLVLRYHSYGSGSVPAAHEGTFLPCSFWLVDNYVLQGRLTEARELFERLLGLCNDVGLLSEEYDVKNGCMAGNFPQALSHAALVTSAHNLNEALHRNHARSGRGEQFA